MTTNNELYVALQELNDLFDKAGIILNGLSQPARDALLNKHSEDTNLIHVVRWGNQNVCELIDEMSSNEVIFDEEKQAIIDIKKPYKSESFLVRLDPLFSSKVIYVPKLADDINESMTSESFAHIVKEKLSVDEEKSVIDAIAERVWTACEWQHPEALIDELGIDFFRKDQDDDSDDEPTL